MENFYKDSKVTMAGCNSYKNLVKLAVILGLFSLRS